MGARRPLSAQTGLLVSNPAVYFAAVPPHLIMSVVEIEDVDQTHRRLMDALAQTLPEQTVVEPVDIIDPHPAGVTNRGACSSCGWRSRPSPSTCSGT